MYDRGVVFEITSSGTMTTLHSFCMESGTACADGASPEAGPVLANDGNFYGTANGGGTQGYGTIFRIGPSGTFTTIYNSCALTTCADGANPCGTLVQGRDGDLYGTTSVGGPVSQGHSQLGTIFKVTTSGALTTLSAFDAGQCSTANGQDPLAGLVEGSDGNFYGTTIAGGTQCDTDCGTIFKVTPGGAFITLYSFCPSCTGGQAREAALIQGTDGMFYGTADEGGPGGVARFSASL